MEALNYLFSEDYPDPGQVVIKDASELRESQKSDVRNLLWEWQEANLRQNNNLSEVCRELHKRDEDYFGGWYYTDISKKRVDRNFFYMGLRLNLHDRLKEEIEENYQEIMSEIEAEIDKVFRLNRIKLPEDQ